MRNINRKLGEHDDYNPVLLSRNYSYDELKTEYKRMRDNLRKNVERIKKSADFFDAQVVETYNQFEAPLNYDKLQLAMKLSNLENVLSANTATLTGLREQRESVIKTLNDRGYTEINKGNFREFTAFMNATRSLAISILRYSYDNTGNALGEDRNKRLEMFGLAQRKGITNNTLIKDFKFFSDHLDEIKKLPDRNKGRKLGIKSLRKMLK